MKKRDYLINAAKLAGYCVGIVAIAMALVLLLWACDAAGLQM